jgi:UDP-2-acetamido-3-amino-2,3-dideoxy-glucuronate N-acetyltransferase
MTGPPGAPFVHERAICESSDIGAGTRVWAFAHVLPGAVIGSDCNLCDGVFVENDVIVGDRVTIKSGVQLWDGVRLGDDVFVGPNVAFTNDRTPRSKRYPEKFEMTIVEDGASLGANSTILPGLTIGREAMVGAGAVVTRAVPPHAVVAGNPARIIGYVDGDGRPRPSRSRPVVATPSSPDGSLVTKVGVGEVVIYHLDAHSDLRGSLAAGELSKDLPFLEVARLFMVYDVPNVDVRGEHAHRECHQLLVCAHGSVSLLVDDGVDRAVVDLDSPSLAVYMPPGIWGSQFNFSADAVLVVLASHPYDGADYIRTYPEFLDQLDS